jgi:hypothetical protein
MLSAPAYIKPAKSFQRNLASEFTHDFRRKKIDT